MTGHVGVVTDSACDLPDDIVSRLGIQIVPLSIRFGDDEFVDREELSTAEFWARCKASPTLPSTAAPSPGRFEQAYRQLADDGARHIVAITLSGALSATLQSAELAAKSVAADGIDSHGRRQPHRVARDGDDRSRLRPAGGHPARRRRVLATDRQPPPPSSSVAHASSVPSTRWTTSRRAAASATPRHCWRRRCRSSRSSPWRTGSSSSTAGSARGARHCRFLVDKVAAASRAMEHLAVLHADCDDVDEFVAQLRPFYPGRDRRRTDRSGRRGPRRTRHDRRRLPGDDGTDPPLPQLSGSHH